MTTDSNPIALVTGASRGIGASIARALSEAGAFVVVAARGLAGCEAAVEEIRAAGGRGAALGLDVSDRSACAEVAARVESLTPEGRPATWLVNNAGIARSAPLEKNGALGSPETDSYATHLEVNFLGPVRLAEALLPGMKSTGGGRIINVASSAGLVGYPYVSAYCASKHALVGWTRAAGLELEKANIQVSAVCPHYVDSPMLAASIDNVVEKTGKSEAQAREFFASQNPSGRLVSCDAVAAAVVHLLTETERAPRVLELDGSDDWIERD